MIAMNRGVLLVGLVLSHPLALAAQTSCQEIRAAIDIGSGTTKMVVARVDSCLQTVEEILAPRPGSRLEFDVEYKKNTVQRADGQRVFRPGIEAAGLTALAEFAAIARAHGASKVSAVATSAFRQVSATYAANLVARIHKAFNVRVRVIEQSEEARLGFLATIVKLAIPRGEAIVWDIGGGSMQLSYWNEEQGRVAGYTGRFANNAMQAFVVEQLQGHPPGTDISPNPILRPDEKGSADNHLLAAIHEAEKVALMTTSAQQRAAIRTLPSVIGIGGVHFYSNCEVTRQNPGCELTRDRLQTDILAHADLTDAQLVEAGRASNVKFAAKRITAGALTVGFMRALGIERVRSLKVDMGDGILLDPDYWR